jgi:hypothetical protein
VSRSDSSAASKESTVNNIPLQNRGVNARDVRIDFFRGLALYMVLVDHVIGDPISKFTYQRFGFSDAAEIFVFLSGISCGIVYSRELKRGWLGFMTKIARRTVLIYVYYVLSSILVTLLITVAAGSIKNAGVVDQSLVVLREDPISTIWSTVFLISSPDLPSILVLYIEMTLAVIPLFLILATRRPTLTLAASGLIWIISQIHPELSPNLANQYFNLFAWQFLFSIGIFIGIRHNSNCPELLSTQTFKWLLVAAWTIVIISLLYRITFHVLDNLNFGLEWFRILNRTLLYRKENLSPVRLLHFLSIAFLVSTYLPSSSRIFKSSGFVAVTRVGSRSLEMFSMTVVLSVALSIIGLINRPPVLEKLILDGTGMLLMTLIAAILTTHRTRGPRQAA